MSDEREYVTLREAAARLRLSEPALRRRLDRGLIKTFTSPLDLRSRLIRAADLDAFLVPQPITPAEQDHEGGGGAMSAA